MPLALAMAACSEVPVEAPAPPPMFETYAEYPFGTQVHARDGGAQGRMLDLLAPRFERVSAQRWAMPGATAPAALQAHYRQALPGFQPLGIGSRDLPAGAWGFALARGEHVLAVTGLEADGASAVPVTVLTNLPSKRPSS